MAMTRIELGICTILASNTSVNVTFTNAFKAATTPYVDVKNKPRNTNYWLTNITNTGFTLNVSAAPTPYDEDWGYEAKGID